MAEPGSEKSSKTKHTCAVAICGSPKDASYHRFPKAEALCKAWLAACRRKDVVNVKTAYVCNEHFLDEDFERDFRNELLNLPTRRKLKPGNLSLKLP